MQAGVWVSGFQIMIALGQVHGVTFGCTQMLGLFGQEFLNAKRYYDHMEVWSSSSPFACM